MRSTGKTIGGSVRKLVLSDLSAKYRKYLPVIDIDTLVYL